VTAVPERLNALPLESIEALVLSVEDIGGSTQLLDRLAQRVPIVVLTQGSRGYTLVVRGASRPFPAAPALELDPTGAGDVFAAAFFARLNETGDPEGSARFAAVTAAISVEGEEASRVPARAEVEARLNKWQTGEPHG
jgi:sugar/nucleoside kinase (ribokinase family)